MLPVATPPGKTDMVITRIVLPEGMEADADEVVACRSTTPAEIKVASTETRESVLWINML